MMNSFEASCRTAIQQVDHNLESVVEDPQQRWLLAVETVLDVLVPGRKRESATHMSAVERWNWAIRQEVTRLQQEEGFTATFALLFMVKRLERSDALGSGGGGGVGVGEGPRWDCSCGEKALKRSKMSPKEAYLEDLLQLQPTTPTPPHPTSSATSSSRKRTRAADAPSPSSRSSPDRDSNHSNNTINDDKHRRMIE